MGSLLPALALLSAAPPGFELVLQVGHGEGVDAGFSPDERQVLTSGGGSARIWDVASGYAIRTLRGFGSGRYLKDGSLLIWTPDKWVVLDPSTGAVRRTVDEGGGLSRGSPTPDGSTAVFTRDRGVLNLTDFRTGKLRRELIAYDGGAPVLSPDGRFIIESRDGPLSGCEMLVLDATTGQEVRRDARCGRELTLSPDSKLLAMGRPTGEVQVIDLKTWTVVRELKEDGYITALAFSPDSRLLATGTFTEIARASEYRARVVSVATGETVATFKPGGCNARSSLDCPKVSSVEFSRDGARLLVGTGSGKALLFDLASGRVLRSFEGAVSSLRGMALAAEGKTLAVASRDGTTALWDLATGRIRQTLPGTEAALALAAEGDLLAIAGHDRQVRVFDLAKGSLRSTMEFPGPVRAVALSPDQRHVLAIADEGDAVLLELASKRELWRRGGLLSSGHADLSFSRDGRLFAVTGDQRRVVIGEVASGRVLRELETWRPVFVHARLDGRGARLLGRGPEDGDDLALYDVGSGQVLHRWQRLGVQPTAAAFTPDDRHLFLALEGDGVLIDLTSYAEVWRLERHEDGLISDAVFSSDGKTLYTAGENEVRVFDAASGRSIARLIQAGPEFAALTPEGYYTTSRGAARAVHFSKGLTPFPFDSFDLVYNRPDRVAARLRVADPATIAALERAYEKRVRAHAGRRSAPGAPAALPTVALVGKDVPLVTGDPTIALAVRATDPGGLASLDVDVNGVPLRSRAGIPLRGKDAKVTVTVELAHGKNLIEVSARGQSGLASLKSTIEVRRTGAAEPTTSVVAIGVSKYRDARHDLDYAAKDAADLAAAWRERAGPETRVLLLTDQDATREKIREARAFLAATGPDDKVVLFVAGHGLLDEELDYYFATHDVDFERPGDRGMLFGELEALFDGIPARQRLLLVDTCHSGEVDEDDAPRELALAPGVKGRGLKGTTAPKPGTGGPSVLPLLEELFTDLRRGSGATILSSASGMEYSFESATWSNGVFTYAVLEGLKSGAADRDANGAVQVSELFDYVLPKVVALTSGRQHPTSRRENVELDFSLF